MKEFKARIYDFDGTAKTDSLSLEHAFNLVHGGEYDVILLQVESQEGVELWWGKHDDLAMNGHRYHTGIMTSGMTLGKLQRATNEEYQATSELYFNSANVVNAALKQTPYFEFFEQGLSAKTLEVEPGREMLIASQREYPPSTEKNFSFAPHADSISYARANDSWPIKTSYPQTAAFITVQNAANEAGFVMWDYLPSSRSELDEFIALYGKDEAQGMEFLAQFESMEINPEVGELCIFNCRKMHGIQTCDTLRKTIGSFFIKKDGWRIFD
ncbi:hypothetical protein [Pseudoalteromonas rubra]|uniref:TauD/TfdA-like domain-containing protein n=1 Tax=Pseudoalteromonas rubra TaxID=43658 RepID=A0A0U3I294_9GAMM|nr:hypothetical protein [Pseudoalteromonas rubra]ALU41744.1 hypothetical protein AT705_01660 [Pseudoalteromonas rubra]